MNAVPQQALDRGAGDVPDRTAGDPSGDRILILDFGSQTTQLIARRIREHGVYCEIRPFDLGADAIRAFAPRGVVLSGGPETVTGDATPRIDDAVFESRVPVLGICYGMQAMAAQLGGAVERSPHSEFGHAVLRVAESQNGGLFAGLGPALDVWMSHGDKVTTAPPGFEVAAESANAPIAAMANAERGLFGVQFHPEVTHTEGGGELLRRFVRDIAGCDGDWTVSNIIEQAVARIREQVGDDRVVLGLSGGVDSSVVAALLSRAIGKRLACVFVDNGLLRKGEAADVRAAFGGASNALPIDVRMVDASDEFLNALAGVDAPEAKRKAIGRTFVEVFEREASRIQGARWLAQGTIYPDVIESAGTGGKTRVIKSHHNVGGLPERMNLRLLEPLRDLFKDEVRNIGLALGLPEELIHRHPFPGPGLAVRALGEVRREHLEALREADAIFLEELRRADWYRKVSQAFAVHLPVRSVGVVGDARLYENVIALRAVQTTDFMTARWAALPHDLLARASSRIVNEVYGVSRVVYDVTGKPPGTIEWE